MLLLMFRQFSNIPEMFIILENLEFAKLTQEEAHFIILMAMRLKKKQPRSSGMLKQQKAGFEHFMMKEIHEQPKAIQDTAQFGHQRG